MKGLIILTVTCTSVLYFAAGSAVFFKGTDNSSIYIDKLCKRTIYSRGLTYTGLVYFYKAGCYMGKEV